jgi:CheY-like chemotaxis protein
MNQAIRHEDRGSAMGSKSRNSMLIDNSGARTRPPSSDEVVEVSRDGGVTWCSPVSKRQLRVLVADDDRDAADSLSMLVKIWGHKVWVACDGAAALEMASAYQVDVLLLDIAMPTMDGCQVARQLRRQARFEDTLLIAITGWADQAHRLLAAEAGFDLYLIKPVEPSTMEVLLVLEQDRLAHSSAALLATPRRDGIHSDSATHRNGDGWRQSADPLGPANQALPVPVSAPSRRGPFLLPLEEG